MKLRKRQISLLHLSNKDRGLDSITSTVDHTWALIFHVHGLVAAAAERVRNAEWGSEGLIRDSQLSSLTLGVVGAGRIGFRVARVGQAFGMRIHIFDPSQVVKASANAEGMFVCESLRQLFETSNYVSLHATSSPENFAMVGREVLQRTRQVHLFNTARGELVDEQAVVESIRAGQLSGYHADVLVAENTRGGLGSSPIYRGLKSGLPITVTPHVGGSSADAMVKAEELILGKISRLLFPQNKEGNTYS